MFVEGLPNQSRSANSTSVIYSQELGTEALTEEKVVIRVDLLMWQFSLSSSE